MFDATGLRIDAKIIIYIEVPILTLNSIMIPSLGFHCHHSSSPLQYRCLSLQPNKEKPRVSLYCHHTRFYFSGECTATHPVTAAAAVETAPDSRRRRPQCAFKYVFLILRYRPFFILFYFWFDELVWWLPNFPCQEVERLNKPEVGTQVCFFTTFSVISFMSQI